MVVRFITKRFIGTYDNVDEKLYTHTTIIDNELIHFEIIDRPGHFNTMDLDQLKTPSAIDHSGGSRAARDIKDLDAQLKWADAFVLVYSVTDKCSFDECHRLKFLINYYKRRRKLTNNKDALLDVPVVLVANKSDQCEDRMVTIEEGYRRSKEISCVSFHEISAREEVDGVTAVFRDLTRYWRLLGKSPKLKRSTSDSHEPDSVAGCYQMKYSLASSPNSHSSSFMMGTRPEKRMSVFFGRLWAESSPDEADELDEDGQQQQRFRDRASTEGALVRRPRIWKFPPPAGNFSRVERRMSMSLRGQY